MIKSHLLPNGCTINIPRRISARQSYAAHWTKHITNRTG